MEKELDQIDVKDQVEKDSKMREDVVEMVEEENNTNSMKRDQLQNNHQENQKNQDNQDHQEKKENQDHQKNTTSMKRDQLQNNHQENQKNQDNQDHQEKKENQDHQKNTTSMKTDQLQNNNHQENQEVNQENLVVTESEPIITSMTKKVLENQKLEEFPDQEIKIDLHLLHKMSTLKKETVREKNHVIQDQHHQKKDKLDLMKPQK